jgi:putative integral membrane protein (TIGR02587 family)
LRDFTRAIAGAFLFGVPLIYTMEMWGLGTTIEPSRVVGLVAAAFVLNLGIAYFAGFKDDRSFGAVVEQAIDVVAVGLIAATVVLLILNRFDPGDPLDATFGMILVQAVPLSIGASAANAIFKPSGAGDQPRPGEDLSDWRHLALDVGGTVVGGVFIGFSVAPTEEIPLLAAELEVGHLLAVMACSLLLAHAIVFASGFQAQATQGPFQHPVTETALSYLVSLVVAAIVLYLFAQVTADDPPRTIAARTIVLALPTSLGGAAGRLVL